MVIRLIFEFLAVVLVIYGYMHEDEVIEFEDVIFKHVKMQIAKRRGQKHGQN